MAAPDTKFTSAIAPDLLQSINAQKIGTVFDQLQLFKDLTIYEQQTIFNPLQIRNRNFLKRFLYELGRLEQFSGAPYYIIERLIFNAYDIFALKGTRKGLQLLIKSCCDGDIESDFDKWWAAPYIIPGNVSAYYPAAGPLLYGYGLAPNGHDLGSHPINDAFAFGLGVSPLYLFGGSFSSYYGQVDIAIVSPYVGLTQFRTFLAGVLVDFLPMAHPESTTINITYYDYGMTPVGTYVI